MTRIKIDQWDQVHSTLKDILKDLEGFMGEQVVTSAHRKGDKGVHGQWPSRGLDVECQDPVKGRQVEDFINGLWKYDPTRPGYRVAIFHDVGLGAHVHLQCHPRTERV